MNFAVNLIISATVISLTTWLAGKRPEIAGFLISLPISTLLVLALTQNQYGDAAKTVALAKSVFFALPLTLVFFVPFLISEKFKIPFWWAYGMGLGLLGAAYVAHQMILKSFR